MPALDENDRVHLFEGFALDLSRGCVTHSGEAIHLRPQTYEVLTYLVKNRGHLSSKDKLIEEVWKGRAVTDGSLGKCIEELRHSLGPEARNFIRNVHGRGYILDYGNEPANGALSLTQSEQLEVARATATEKHKELFQQVSHPSLTPLSARNARTAVLAAGALTAAIAIAAYWFFSNRAPNSALISSVAVLPFKNESGNPEVEYLSDGMTESLINTIAQLPQLSVKARSTVFRYKGREADMQRIASELSVQAIVEGRLVQRGDDLTLYLALVDGRNGNQIWGRQYDRRLSDLLTLQEEIGHDVSHQLRVRLSGGEEPKVPKNYTRNVEAYQLYLRGRYHALKRTLPETEKAISYFRQAIDLDPSYALAYAGLADAHFSTLASAPTSKEFLLQARAAAQKAIEIDDTLAEAHAELGFIVFWHDWDWGEAENHLRRALELDPNNADAHLFYAHVLSNTGRHEESLAQVKRARELDPLNLRINALEGQFLIHAGRTDEALTRLRETLTMDPNYFLARLYSLSAYIEKGMYSEAISEARKAREISEARSTYAEAFLGYALAKSGRRAEARSVIDAILRSSADPYHIALIHNGLGEPNEALASLEQAYTQRSPGMVFLKAEPKWNNLRSNPRFRDLLRRLRLDP